MKKIWLTIRYMLSFVFLWAFFDKVFGLGFATEKSAAWINGGSPTAGYLTYATKGPFAEYFQAMAGSHIVDCLFMAALLFVGLSLLTGILFRFGALSGMLFYALLYISGFLPPEHNPVIDDHVINFVLLLGLYIGMPVGNCAVSRWWQNLSLVKKYPALK